MSIWQREHWMSSINHALSNAASLSPSISLSLSLSSSLHLYLPLILFHMLSLSIPFPCLSPTLSLSFYLFSLSLTAAGDSFAFNYGNHYACVTVTPSCHLCSFETTLFPSSSPILSFNLFPVLLTCISLSSPALPRFPSWHLCLSVLHLNPYRAQPTDGFSVTPKSQLQPQLYHITHHPVGSREIERRERKGVEGERGIYIYIYREREREREREKLKLAL